MWRPVPQNALSVKLKHQLIGRQGASSDLAHGTRQFAFNSAGTVLATTVDGTAKLWNTQTGQLKLILEDHKGRMFYVSISKDGRTVMTYGVDKMTRLWSSESGKLKGTLDGFVVPQVFGASDGFAFYNPGYFNTKGLAIVTTTDRELKFWDAETGELAKVVPAYKRTFSDSIFSSDGRLVLRYGGKRAFLWQTENGRLRAELKPPDKRTYLVPYYVDIKVENARFSPDSQIVATGDSLNSVEVWDAQTGKLRALLEGHSSSIYDLEFSPDGKVLATASRDGTVKLWDVTAGKLKHTLKAGEQIARRVEFSPDAKVLAVGYQNRARLWDVTTGQLRAELPEDKDISKRTFFGTYLEGIELRFSPEGRLLLTNSPKTVKVWDAKTGEFITSLEGARPPVAFSSNGKFLATAGRDKSVLLWEVTSR